MSYKFNINDKCRVKLTFKGLKELERKKYKAEEIDKIIEDGYWETQVWVLMNTLGDRCFMGAENVIDKNIIEILSEK